MSDQITKPRKRRTSKLGPRSALRLMDGRAVEARFLREHRARLIEHCAGQPTATQLALIDRAGILALRLHLMDMDTLESGAISERNGRDYLAWNNAYTRTLRAIGLKAGAQKTTHSLADHLAAKRGAL